VPHAVSRISCRFTDYIDDIHIHINITHTHIHIPRRFTHYIDDLEHHTLATLTSERARANNPKLPCFILGESMGGMLALELERRGTLRQHLAGMILTGTVVRVAPAVLPPKPVVWLIRQIAQFFPLVELPDDSLINTFDEVLLDLCVCV
jgi:alpha-beta hydrolase superfamily lysophospholipase